MLRSLLKMLKMRRDFKKKVGSKHFSVEIQSVQKIEPRSVHTTPMRYRNYRRGSFRRGRQYAQQQTALNTQIAVNTPAFTTGTFDLVDATNE